MTKIVIIEDETAAVFIYKRLIKTKISADIETFTYSGSGGILDFVNELRGKGKFILLLDQNLMNGKTGLAVLRDILSDPEVSSELECIIGTSTETMKDDHKAYYQDFYILKMLTEFGLNIPYKIFPKSVFNYESLVEYLRSMCDISENTDFIENENR